MLFKKKEKEKKASKVINANESAVASESTAAARALPCRIKIYCVGGYSTSFWAKNVTAEFAVRGISAEVSAYPIADIDATGAEADMILIGPQARYIEEKARKLFPETPIAVVPFDVFGRANGTAGVEFIKNLSESSGKSHIQELGI
ncbi:MAG: hypothetical protein LBS02_12045 [Hungatella sp.]|jgi:PTS system cellobiose-specific IIB component|nr:hypothetical protein [Hungatella sp.]